MAAKSRALTCGLPVLRASANRLYQHTSKASRTPSGMPVLVFDFSSSTGIDSSAAYICQISGTARTAAQRAGPSSIRGRKLCGRGKSSTPRGQYRAGNSITRWSGRERGHRTAFKARAGRASIAPTGFTPILGRARRRGIDPPLPAHRGRRQCEIIAAPAEAADSMHSSWTDASGSEFHRRRRHHAGAKPRPL